MGALGGLGVVLGLSGCGSGVGPDEGARRHFSDADLKEIYRLSPLGPLPDDSTNRVADDPRAAHLGRYLFFDSRFSRNGQVSCASCHDPEEGFADPEALSQGIGLTRRHAPTVLNTAYNRWFFWDGRADSHWSQALKPTESPAEHGSSRLEVAHAIGGDAALAEAYRFLFGALPPLDDLERFPRRARPVPGEPSHPDHQAWVSMAPDDQAAATTVFVNFGKAIAAYERRLVRGDAPFDLFVAGLREGDEEKIAAISASATRGLRLFIGRAQCVLCHSGANFTDLEFHNVGLGERDGLSEGDLGRWQGSLDVLEDEFNALGPHSDDTGGQGARRLEFLFEGSIEQLGQFKTPSLRNVVETAPYMHGGHFDELRDVLRFYSELDEIPAEVPPPAHREEVLDTLSLSEEELDDLEAFLHTLTGAPLDPELMSKPASPLLP